MNQETPPAEADKATGLPLLRSWRAVYAFVLGVFLVYAALLAALTSLNS